jgi:phosphatidate phosphatase
MYTMTFAALYLHCRMDWKGSKLAKHFLQYVFLALAWFTALSRVSDYKHHWSDAMAGSIQGLVVALIIIYGVTDLFKNRWNNKKEKSHPASRYELDSPQSRSIN